MVKNLIRRSDFLFVSIDYAIGTKSLKIEADEAYATVVGACVVGLKRSRERSRDKVAQIEGVTLNPTHITDGFGRVPLDAHPNQMGQLQNVISGASNTSSDAGFQIYKSDALGVKDTFDFYLLPNQNPAIVGTILIELVNYVPANEITI